MSLIGGFLLCPKRRKKSIRIRRRSFHLPSPRRSLRRAAAGATVLQRAPRLEVRHARVAAAEGVLFRVDAGELLRLIVVLVHQLVESGAVLFLRLRLWWWVRGSPLGARGWVGTPGARRRSRHVSGSVHDAPGFSYLVFFQD